MTLQAFSLLPASPDQSAEEPPAGDVTEAVILVVDDSPLMRAVLGGYLRRDGFRSVVFAADGVAALELAREHRPDLIVTDLMMPRMDGFDLCRMLRADAATQHTPILVQTAMDLSEDRSRVFHAGATDLIVKPVEPRELLIRVRIHLSHVRTARELAWRRDRMAADRRRGLDMLAALGTGDDALAALAASHRLILRRQATLAEHPILLCADAIDGDRVLLHAIVFGHVGLVTICAAQRLRKQEVAIGAELAEIVARREAELAGVPLLATLTGLYSAPGATLDVVINGDRSSHTLAETMLLFGAPRLDPATAASAAIAIGRAV